MMLSTHILSGGVVGLALSYAAPEIAVPLVVIGMIAGLLPDLDMFAEHRKTFHRPVEFTMMFLGAITVFAAGSDPGVLLVSVFFGSMAVHSVSEILGQGKTKNPDLKKDDRAVYNHVAEEWFEPARKVGVGSAPDLLLTLVLTAPLIATGNPWIVLLSFIAVVEGVLHFLIDDWITKSLLRDYDRYSEAIQYKIGYGPELEN